MKPITLEIQHYGELWALHWVLGGAITSLGNSAAASEEPYAEELRERAHFLTNVKERLEAFMVD